MYKIISIIVFGLVICDAGATTMCAQDDKVVIGLNYATTPTSYEADNENSEWRVYYDGIGTISGISSCANFGRDSTYCTIDKQFDGIPIQDNAYGCSEAAAGYDKNSNYQGRRDGNNCWCKLMRPFESGWIVVMGGCANCATSCADYFKGNTYSSRNTFFYTIGMDDDYTVPAN